MTTPGRHADTIRRSLTTTGADDHDTAADLAGEVDGVPAPPGISVDDLVDRVVERIEQRVVDELERRGRRFPLRTF